VRILIASDLHANPDALAVLPDADATLCAGDLVDFGPDPGAAITWCRDRKAVVVTGNHDYALTHDVDCGVKGAMREASVQTRRAHARMLSAQDRNYLRSLPRVSTVTIAATSFALTHATPDDLYRYARLSDAGALLAKRVPEAGVLILGHTHMQERFEKGGRTFVNPGSVGVSSDGGKAHYALWEDGVVTLQSAPYDFEAAIAKLRALALDASAFEPIARALRCGRKRGPNDFM